MKFKKLLSAITLLSLYSSLAIGQVTPRPIAASSVYNGAGSIFIPTATPFGNQACFFDNNSTLASSITTALELTYVHGATSNLQAQINAVSAGAVLSVFGRTGAIVAASGDYSTFYLSKANNLSDVTNAATARANLGLGTACTQSTAAFDAAGAAATAQANAIAASDPSGSAATVSAASLQKSANLSDVVSTTTARANLGLGSAAVQANTFFAQVTNNLSDLTSASIARGNLGLGSAATQPTSAFDASGAAAAVSASSLQRASNLSDLVSPSAARTNLGLGTAATQSTAAFDAAGAAAAAQTAAQAASDPVGSAATVSAASLQKATNLSDLTSASIARANLGLGTAATQSTAAFDAAGAATAVQALSLQKSSNLSDVANPATARTSLGLGSAALQPTSAFDASGAAATAQANAIAASDPSGAAATAQAASLQKSSNLSDLTSASNARANLGLGSAAVQSTAAFQSPLVFSQSLLNTAGNVALVNDAPSPGATQFYGTDSFGLKGWFPLPAGGSGGGGVSSVGLTAPAWLTVTGSPITTFGNLILTGTSEPANEFLASPNGSAGALSPRLMVAADLPSTVVTPGSYTSANITVDAQGRLTSAANGSGGGGGVSSVAGTNANGFSFSISNPTTTPNITLSTTVAAGLVKSTGTALSSAVAGTDYQSPLSFIDSLTNSANNVSFVNDLATPGNTMLYGTNGAGVKGWYAQPGGGGGGGTVTSVALTVPSWLTVGGSPVTTSGTLAVTGTSEPQNLFLASPNGSAGAVTPRSIVAADIPTLNQNTTGNAATVTTNANLTGPVTSVGNATSITATAVTAGSYTSANITVGADGRLTAASNGSGGGGTVTSVTASSPLASSGGATPNITLNSVVPINLGGTNSVTALNNSRVMESVGGAIVEAPAITAHRAVVTDAAGLPIASSVTDTTLAFLDATSSVQTQLNGKQSTLTPGLISSSTTGVTVGSGASSTVGPNVTVDVQNSTNSQPGLLTAADHTNFAAKQSALVFSDSVVNTAGNVTLVGDSATPPASSYYGTDAGSVLGFHPAAATGPTGPAGPPGTGGVVEFKTWGALNGTPSDFGEPHYWAQPATLSVVYMSEENCGSAGSTTIAVNQWRAGAIIDTATGSLASTGGQCGASVSLNHSQSILTGDTTTVDLTGVPTGGRALTVAIDSGALAGPAGPTGSAGPNAVTTATTTTFAAHTMLSSNGTNVSAGVAGTDFSLGTSALVTGIVKTTTGTGALTVAVSADFPTLNQSTTGNAATVTTNANLTGPVTSVGNATSVTTNAITDSMLAQTAAHTYLGNNTGSLANVAAITNTQLTADLNAMVADTASTAGTQGMVPAAPAATTRNGNFLTGSGFGYVDQSKPQYSGFSLLNQTADTVTNIKLNNIALYTGIDGNKKYAALVGGTSATLSIFDITDQAIPKLLFNNPVISGVTLTGALNISIATISGHVYAFLPSNGATKVYIVDITDPLNPSLTTTFTVTGSPGSIYGGVYNAGYMYLATQSTGLVTLDVGGGGSGGTLLAPVQSYQEGGGVKSFGVFVANGTLFTTQYTTSVFTTRQIKSWSISTPQTPSLTQSFQVTTSGEALGITVSGNTAIVTVQGGGNFSYDLIDVTTPSAMANLSQINFPTGYVQNSAFVGVASGNYLFLPWGSNSTFGGRVDLYDITTRSAPVFVSNAVTSIASSVFGGIALDPTNGYIYASDYGVAPGTNGNLDVFVMPKLNSVHGNVLASTITATTGITYAPGTPGNWSPAPSQVAAALDQLATRTAAVPSETLSTKTTTYTITLADQDILADATGGAFTITLPSAASAFVGGKSQVFVIKKKDSSANAVTISGGGANIDGAATQALTVQYASITIVTDGVNYYVK